MRGFALRKVRQLLAASPLGSQAGEKECTTKRAQDATKHVSYAARFEIAFEFPLICKLLLDCRRHAVRHLLVRLAVSWPCG